MSTHFVHIDGVEYVPMTWKGLLAILDKVYPSDIFDGTDDGDPGPAIISHLRAINAIRQSQLRF